MGKASTSKRLRRESGIPSPNGNRAVSTDPRRFGICAACGKSGLVSRNSRSCIGAVEVNVGGLVRVQSRAVACYQRVQRRQERKRGQ